MKKLLILFAVATLAACSTEEAANDSPAANFGGTLTVTDNTKTPPVATTSENVTYQLDESNDGMLMLTMPGIQFVSNMPPMTIVIPKLTSTKTGNGITLTSTVTPIVPYIGGTPYKDYKITDFSGTLTDGSYTLTVKFTCAADITLPNGHKLVLNHHTSFTGKLLL